MNWNRVILLFLVLCLASSKSSDGEELARSSKEDMGIRDKRGIIGSPTAHPSRLSVTVMTAQSNLFATVYRKLISFERQWYDLTSQKSLLELATYLVLGIITTFLAIFLPLALVSKLLPLPLPIVKRSVDEKQNLLRPRFQLPEWMRKEDD